MRDFLLNSLDNPNFFYKKITKKSNVSVGSAYNNTKDIYEKEIQTDSFKRMNRL